MKGGAIQKLILDGLEWVLSSDNDGSFTKGGRYITEKQETTGAPFFLVDKVSGALTGLEARLGHSDGSFENFDSMLQKCANGENGVSARVILADGTKYTAPGGANVVPDNPGDGMITTREGKLAFGIHPIAGEWIAS